MSRICVIGFGPGNREFMTEQAIKEIERADVVIGYTFYVDIIRPIFPDKVYFSTPMKKEIDRCSMALDYALSGKNVALVSSGDSGIYGMAGIMLEIVNERKADVEVLAVPGVTAASAAAAILGAPLMHDFSVISLSDLMTPIDLIMKRIRCAAEGDFVICLYNPKSKKRADYINQAVDIILEYRNSKTPVGIVRHAGRCGQSATITDLGKLKEEQVDMFCVVIIGNTGTYVKNGKMITPRGYKLQGEI
ncbi:MAG: precorrin-3B C(17)-methyltransferase [Clostridia bacterium]|nr:precorrin-3B C(17)-methyltransferase [Clostridia bacterium]